MAKRIITISREFGSGGRFIGEEVAKKLGITYYDKNIISDYPFSDKQKNYLLNLSKKYNYKIITIRMTADLEILFKRQKTRDLDPSRHLGHILNKYDPKQKTIDRTHAEGLLSHDEFINRCLNRGYNKFQLGDLLTIDVSDFTTADYKTLLF